MTPAVPAAIRGLALYGGRGARMNPGGNFALSHSGNLTMLGNAAGALAPMIVPFVLKATNGNWSANFWMFAAVYAVGGSCWLFIDPVTPLEEQVRN